jgi:hypothetical protein
MDTEPDPPKRPRRSSAEVVLIVVAMSAVVGHLALLVIVIETGLDSGVVPSWGKAVADEAWMHPRLVY